MQLHTDMDELQSKLGNLHTQLIEFTHMQQHRLSEELRPRFRASLILTCFLLELGSSARFIRTQPSLWI